MSRPGGKLWQGSDDESSASETEAVVDLGGAEKRQQKRWEVDSDSGTCGMLKESGREGREARESVWYDWSVWVVGLLAFVSPLIWTYPWAC